jgi:hypothetical protein
MLCAVEGPLFARVFTPPRNGSRCSAALTPPPGGREGSLARRQTKSTPNWG